MFGRRRVVRHPVYGTPMAGGSRDRCQAPGHVCALCAEDKRLQALTPAQHAAEIRDQRACRAAERAEAPASRPHPPVSVTRIIQL